MATKQLNGFQAPDGANYVTITDGVGNLIGGGGPSGGQEVEGTIATGATDSGNPVKVGGVYRATTPTFTDGQRTELEADVTGNLRVSPAFTQSTGTDATANTFNFTLSRGTQAALNALTAAGNFAFNGTTWDRIRTLGGATQTASQGILASAPVPNTSALAGLPSVATSAVNSALVLKASAGNLYSFTCNAGASAGYLMVFNATSAPADGAVTPIYTEPVAINSTITRSFNYPIVCSTGITLVFSTTGPFLKTASATAFLAGQSV